MKNLEEVKEDYAKHVGYKCWSDLLNDDNLEQIEIYGHYDQIAISLANQCISN